MSTQRYFPDIIDERSSYLNLSPLTAIIQNLRRKNVVTAAAASGPQQMSLLDSSDPWGSSEGALGSSDNDRQHQHQTPVTYGTTCSCDTRTTPTAQQRRRSSLSFGKRRASWFGNLSPSKASLNNGSSKHGSSDKNNGMIVDSSSTNGKVCDTCGKIRRNYSNVDGGEPRSPRQVRVSSWLESTRIERLEAPQHTEALLQSTPQLRVISPASTDMQGAGATSPTNFLSMILPAAAAQSINNSSTTNNQDGGKASSSSSRTNVSDYRASLVRDRANQQAAAELSSLLWILAHEMSLEDYGTVESEVFTSVFGLVHSQENEKRMAGLAAVDALIDAPSADEEKKAIKFANTLSNGLRSAHGDYEFLSAVSKALGHMATRTANVDFVESEVTRALEWLRTERSDRR